MTSTNLNDSISPAFPEKGEIISGRYRLKNELGRGGMGVVYVAEQLALKRDVAIKLTLKSSDPAVEARFMQEASTAAQIDHPNVVQIHDFGKDEKGRMFLVMELLHGQTLHARIKSKGPIDLQSFQELGEQLAEALCVLQGLGIVHRDIKPENIFMLKTPGKRVISRLIDFGLVKDLRDELAKTQTGHVLGSPMYMAPEQIKSAAIDIRTDIYSLGLSLLGAISGKPPYSSTRIEALLHAQLSTPPSPLSVLAPTLTFPPIVQWILDTATAKIPADRFQNPQQLLHVFQALGAGMPTHAYPEFSIKNGQLYKDGMPIDLDGEPERNLNQTITFDSLNTSLLTTQENTAETINVADYQSTQVTTSLSKPPPKEINETPNKWPLVISILLAIALGIAGTLKWGPIAHSPQEQNALNVEKPTPKETPIDQQLRAEKKKDVSKKQQSKAIAPYILKTTPSEAKVFKGEELRGYTPFQYQIADEDLKLRLEHPCCKPLEIVLGKDNPSPFFKLEPLVKEKSTPLKNRRKKKLKKDKATQSNQTPQSGTDLKNPWD